ncbi:hypothetical protein [Bacteroides sp. UBA939]|uniref:hypothetical protein n=1 Tax=Bacteroides sp. UBA939 TaxID=1946092 RepID=UPI0025C01315|nr:hypothetical protein [Bacteroides sp. UBA939]
MPFSCPDIETLKNDLDNNIVSVQKLKAVSHATIKIQSLLNITIYVLATRLLEGSVKHIIYNCCIMRGDSVTQLKTVESELKKFNNPEFQKIKEIFVKHLAFDITDGLRNNWFCARDISFLDEIVKNRHRNVHASHDSANWYNNNIKDLNDFYKEYEGLLNILCYLDMIKWDSANSKFDIV